VSDAVQYYLCNRLSLSAAKSCFQEWSDDLSALSLFSFWSDTSDAVLLEALTASGFTGNKLGCTAGTGAGQGGIAGRPEELQDISARLRALPGAVFLYRWRGDGCWHWEGLLRSSHQTAASLHWHSPVARPFSYCLSSSCRDCIVYCGHEYAFLAEWAFLLGVGGQS
jgi:hypothetical protein